MNATNRTLQAAMEQLRLGHVDSALNTAISVLEIESDHPDALLLAGQAHHARGDHEQAARYLGRALGLAPDHAGLNANLAAVQLALRDPDTAEALARRAVSLAPDLFAGHYNLGLSLLTQRRYEAAERSLSRALQLRPGDPIALKHLAHARYRAGTAPLAARALLEQSLDRLPEDPETLALLADSCIQMAETDRGLELFRQLLERADEFPPEAGARYHSSYLLALQYQEETTPFALLSSARNWAERYAPAAAAAAPEPHGTGKLRIGWLSPRFGPGPSASFLLPVLSAFDRECSEHYLYAGRRHAGSVNQRFREQADAWRDMDGLSPRAAADVIRADRLDILVDLAGHATGSALTTLALRPAPVQVSWLDAFCTTGIEQIEAFLSDPFLSPPGDEANFSEQLVRLEPGRLCYRPPVPVPGVSPRPPDGAVVFGCCNRLSKLNDEVLRAWAAIQDAVPGSWLVMRNMHFDDEEVRSGFLRRCEHLGLASERIELHGYCSYPEFMAAHDDIDVALDPFPFSGCTTTCDALWMGVPVVTRVGATLVSRQGGGILHALGLDELIAGSTEQYVAAAVALAGDPDRRAELRCSLREKMKAAFDPERFAAMLLGRLNELAAAAK